jgi:predicted aspartyl protease
MSEFFFDNKMPLIPVQVALNGKKGIVRMTGNLSTGSTYMVIPPAVAETLGYDLSKPEDKVSVATVTGNETLPLITLDEVSVFNKTIPRVKAIIKELPEESRIGCVVGLTFLRHVQFAVDYQTGTITIQ